MARWLLTDTASAASEAALEGLGNPNLVRFIGSLVGNSIEFVIFIVIAHS
jgi:hypothetical protein